MGVPSAWEGFLEGVGITHKGTQLMLLACVIPLDRSDDLFLGEGFATWSQAYNVHQLPRG